MSNAADDTNQPTNALTRVFTDFAIGVLFMAVMAVILAPQVSEEEPKRADHLQEVAETAGTLQSAASLERAQRLTRGGTVKRDFDSPRTGALRVIPRPIAAADCAQMWNNLMPDGPEAATGGDSLFTVDTTDTRGLCLYRYTAAQDQAYVISYRPESGQVAFN
ncbi:MAG: hypothetical protein AAGA11_00920 [Pseudomonadota bacterium]